MTEFNNVHELTDAEFNNDVRELTDAELDAISGGNWLGDAARWVGHKAVQIVHAL